MAPTATTTSSFPRVRTVLWSRVPQGGARAIAFPRASNGMRVAVSGGALRLVAMQALAEAKRTPLRAFLLGEVAAEVGVAGGALVLTVARFDLGVEDARGQWRPACALPGEVAVPVLVVLEESTDDALTAAEGEAHAAAASVARLAVSAAPRLELGTALGYAATGVLRRRPDAQDGHILSLRWTVTAAACTLEAVPLLPVPLVETALVRKLTGALSLDNAREAGFITLNAERKAILVLETDPAVETLPLVGVWVAGVSDLEHPFVGLACQRYLCDARITERVFVRQQHFLVLVISPDGSKREWFEAKLGKLAAERAAQANGRALEPRLEICAGEHSVRIGGNEVPEFEATVQLQPLSAAPRPTTAANHDQEASRFLSTPADTTKPHTPHEASHTGKMAPAAMAALLGATSSSGASESGTVASSSARPEPASAVPVPTPELGRGASAFGPQRHGRNLLDLSLDDDEHDMIRDHTPAKRPARPEHFSLTVETMPESPRAAASVFDAEASLPLSPDELDAHVMRYSSKRQVGERTSALSATTVDMQRVHETLSQILKHVERLVAQADRATASSRATTLPASPASMDYSVLLAPTTTATAIASTHASPLRTQQTVHVQSQSQDAAATSAIAPEPATQAPWTPSSLGSAYPTPRRANAMKLEMPTTPASGRGCRLAASQATDPAGVSPPPSIRQQCTREALTALPVPATRTSPPSAWSAPEQRAQRRLGSSSSDSALEHEAHSAFQRVSGTALQRAGNGNGNGCSGNDSVLTTAALSPPANHSAPEAVPLPVAEAETEAETEAALRMPTLPTRWLSDAQTVRRASQSPAGSPFRRSAGSSSSRWSAAQAPSPQRHVAATRRSEEARLTERQNKAKAILQKYLD